MQLNIKKLFFSRNIECIFLVFLIFCPIVAFTQKTITVKKEIKGKRKYQSYYEKYHVLKEDNSIKHGLYEVFDSKNSLVIVGHFKNGKRDSIWREYDTREHFISAEGYYTEDKKDGIWTFYKDANTIELKYDFDNKKVLYCKLDSSKKYAILSGRDTMFTTLECPPLYLGGNNCISKIIQNNIEYPDEARESGISGHVQIAFTVYSDGSSSEPWVFKSIHKSIDDEAKRVASLIPENWLPGIKNGIHITSIYVLPIAFIME